MERHFNREAEQVDANRQAFRAAKKLKIALRSPRIEVNPTSSEALSKEPLILDNVQYKGLNERKPMVLGEPHQHANHNAIGSKLNMLLRVNDRPSELLSPASWIDIERHSKDLLAVTPGAVSTVPTDSLKIAKKKISKLSKERKEREKKKVQIAEMHDENERDRERAAKRLQPRQKKNSKGGDDSKDGGKAFESIRLDNANGDAFQCLWWAPDMAKMKASEKLSIVITCAGKGAGPGPHGAYGPSLLYLKLGQVLPCITANTFVSAVWHNGVEDETRSKYKANVGVLNVVYHKDGDLEAGVMDTLWAFKWAETWAAQQKRDVQIVVMGWGMGGWVAVDAAYRHQEEAIAGPEWIDGPESKPILGVVTLCGQLRHTEGASKLSGKHTKLWVLTGSEDTLHGCAWKLKRKWSKGSLGKENVTLKEFEGEGHGLESAWNYLMSELLPAWLFKKKAVRME